MFGFRIPVVVYAFVLSIFLAVPSSLFAAALGAQEATPLASDSGRRPVLLFAAPGMRPDLVESFAAEGALPAMADLLENGAAADDGLLASFPATTGTNLPTLLSGDLAGRTRHRWRSLLPHWLSRFRGLRELERSRTYPG